MSYLFKILSFGALSTSALLVTAPLFAQDSTEAPAQAAQSTDGGFISADVIVTITNAAQNAQGGNVTLPVSLIETIEATRGQSGGEGDVTITAETLNAIIAAKGKANAEGNITVPATIISQFLATAPETSRAAAQENQQQAQKKAARKKTTDVKADVHKLIVCQPIGLNPNQAIGPIVLRSMEIPQVLDLLQQYSGRVIIAGDDLPKVRLNFNSQGTLPREQAIYALENLLSMNGVLLQRGEGKFVYASAVRDPSRRATQLLEDLPETGISGQVFTKIFDLKYNSAANVVGSVRNFTSGNRTSRIQHIDGSNSIMVVDTLNNLRSIERLIQQLDSPSSDTSQIYTYSIRHGDARRVRDTLRQIQRSRAFASSLGDATLWVDDRTNKLIVVTRPENNELLSQLVEDLDEEVAPFTTSKVVSITQGNFWSIWSIINNLTRTQRRMFDRQGFRSTEQTVTRRTTAGETDAEQTTATEGATTEGVTATEGTQGAPAQAAAAGTQTAASSGAQTSVSVETTLTTEAGMPEMQFSPYISVFPDYSNNSFVVYGTHSDILRMEKLVAQLDVKAAPYVASEIVEIHHAQARDLFNLVNQMITSQRRTFARKGLQSGAQEEGYGIEGDGFQFSDFATIGVDWRRNSILVYGTRQDIAQIRGLISKIDQPAAPLTRNEVLYLKHARADTLARIVSSVINYQRSAFNRTRNLSQAQAGDDGAAQMNQMGFEFSDYAVVYADRRSNALFVYGTASDIERVKQMVNEADIPVEPMTQTKIFALTHTDANQSASIIQRIVNAQRQALRQVRSEGREYSNPAARGESGEQNAQAAESPVADGEESLQFSPFMTVTPDVRSNSLVVYGTDGDIHQISELLKQIDIQVAPFTQSQVFFLKSAQSSSLIGILNNIVRGQERALSRVRSRNREIQNTRGVGTLGTGAEDSALQFSPYVTIVENRRNNAIIVYGTPTDIAQIGELIENNDVAIAPYTQTRTYHIRHADAVDTARTITTLINQQQRVREREATLRRVFRRSQAGRDEDLAPGQEAQEAISADELALAEDFDPNAGADLQFSPYVSLVADDRSNSVIAYGTQFDLEQINNLIEQIDKVLPQVRIEVVIAEVRLQGNQVSGLSSFGINYRNPFEFQRVSQTTGGVTNETIMGTTGMQTGMQSLTPGGQPAFDMGLSLNDFSLNTVFRVAQEDQNVKVLSAPTITTTHNRQARINVGEARPIITGSTTNNSTSNLVTSSTVEYRDIGITLRVRPLVSESGAIQLELEQVVENVIGQQTIDGNEQPIISTRRASSFISVQDQEIIIMGGLQSAETTKTQGKVFILGDIPLLGELFRPERNEEVVRELVIFIRPYLVNSTSAEEFIKQNDIDKKSIGEDIKYFLKEGRFREQDRLKEKQDDKQNKADESESADTPQGNADESGETPQGNAAARNDEDATVAPTADEASKNEDNTDDDQSQEADVKENRPQHNSRVHLHNVPLQGEVAPTSNKEPEAEEPASARPTPRPRTPGPR